MKSAIIHISDLHVTLLEGRNGKKNPRLHSYLTHSTDPSSSDFFIKTFINRIKEDFADVEFFLLITGDIADVSDEMEYSSAEKYIKAIMQELDISPARVLLIPGDHDVSRLLLNIELSKGPNNEIHLRNDIKFLHFSQFYRSLKGTDFPFNNCIVDYLILHSRIVLVGCNSNYKIDNEGGVGFIEIAALKRELEELKISLANPDLEYVLCWHHNITAGYEDSGTGQWDKQNRQHLIDELSTDGIKLVLTGNEHISDSRGIFGDAIMTSDCGVIAGTKTQATFKVYEIYVDQKVALGNKCYSLQPHNSIERPYFWAHIPNKDWKQPEEYVLFVPNTQKIDDPIDLPIANYIGLKTSDETELEQPNEVINSTDSKTAKEDLLPVFYDNQAVSQRLYDIIREEKLFHSGHFHWSETSRAHNWIDIPKMLEKSENLYFAQNAIIDVIEQFNLLENCDLIIGLGYEGNIISSKASIKYGKPYTSLPYSYRYNDHHDYEKRLNFDNESSDYKNVMIITDVVNDGRTIRKLVGKREEDFFKNVDKIIVLSLFYTGHENIDISILNQDHFRPGYDIENDHLINNIEFYTVRSMRVDRCPYGKDFRKECLIYKDELSCVHLFYDEQMAVKKSQEKLQQQTEKLNIDSKLTQTEPEIAANETTKESK